MKKLFIVGLLVVALFLVSCARPADESAFASEKVTNSEVVMEESTEKVALTGKASGLYNKGIAGDLCFSDVDCGTNLRCWNLRGNTGMCDNAKGSVPKLDEAKSSGLDDKILLYGDTIVLSPYGHPLQFWQAPYPATIAVIGNGGNSIAVDGESILNTGQKNYNPDSKKYFKIVPIEGQEDLLFTPVGSYVSFHLQTLSDSFVVANKKDLAHFINPIAGSKFGATKFSLVSSGSYKFFNSNFKKYVYITPYLYNTKMSLLTVEGLPNIVYQELPAGYYGGYIKIGSYDSSSGGYPPGSKIKILSKKKFDEKPVTNPK